MKLKFKVQPYQTNAVNDVVDCFAGQPMTAGLPYRIDPGRKVQSSAFEEGFKNADLALTDVQILENIQKVQRRQNLPVSQSLTDFTTFNARGERVPVAAAYKRDALAATRVHLDVEMETGTGKTYCYIKTIFEMNKRYGWSKFIIMVPSIAIREGVYKSLQITADHFTESHLCFGEEGLIAPAQLSAFRAIRMEDTDSAFGQPDASEIRTQGHSDAAAKAEDAQDAALHKLGPVAAAVALADQGRPTLDREVPGGLVIGAEDQKARAVVELGIGLMGEGHQKLSGAHVRSFGLAGIKSHIPV